MKVLVCPLDWGLGHAARCVPVIRALLANGHEVMIAASGGGKRLLEGEFPALPACEFPGYRVRYSRSPSLFLPVLLLQMPALLAGLAGEGLRLRRLLARHRPDRVISDGRYGVHTRRVPCIFINHQLFIRLPGKFPGSAGAEKLLLLLNLALLRRFREVWVPDFPGPANLSGDLSHRPCRLPNRVFIYPLSRFLPVDRNWSAARVETARDGRHPRVDVLALVSGPEPQRGLFEALLRKELQRLPGTRVLIRGLPGQPSPEGLPPLQAGSLHEFPHLSGEAIGLLLQSADLVVARSGYTTVMELASLGQRAVVLVPTPGQSEQEYLADHLQGARVALRMPQDGLDLRGAGKSLAGYAGFAGLAADEASGEGNSLLRFIAAHPLFSRASGSIRPPKVGARTVYC